MSGAGAALDVEVTAVRADVSPSATGWKAVVQHIVVVRATAGGVLGRRDVEGAGWILGTSEEDLRAAFVRAATDAAVRLEAELQSDPVVAAWLSSRGVVLSADAARGSRPNDWAGVFVESGVLMAWHGEGPRPGLTGRAGVASRSFVAALAVETVTLPLQVGRNVRARSLGVDLAWVRRLGPAVEVWGGGSAAGVAGTVDWDRYPWGGPRMTDAESGWSASVFATVLRTARVKFLNVRLGAEVRRRFGPTFEFDTVDAKADLGITSVRFFVGVESPSAARVP